MLLNILECKGQIPSNSELLNIAEVEKPFSKERTGSNGV